MKTLTFKKDKTQLEEKPIPEVDSHFDTLVKVSLTGICKTDVYVSQGKLGSKENLILGHEFSGYVIHSLNNHLKRGDFITCNPIIDNKTMLGVDYDGAFCEYIKVPSSKCYKTNFLDEKLAAYVEPIAASLGSLNNNCTNDKAKKGAIIGQGRIPILTEMVLQQFGCNASHVETLQDEYDYIIETWANEALLDSAIDHLKEKGTLILKSRAPYKVPLDLYKIVRKEIQLEGCYYYNFDKTVNFIEEKQSLFNDLLGEVYTIENWKEAFDKSMNYNKKIFIRPK